jgi:hypothetical protein
MSYLRRGLATMCIDASYTGLYSASTRRSTLSSALAQLSRMAGCYRAAALTSNSRRGATGRPMTRWRMRGEAWQIQERETSHKHERDVSLYHQAMGPRRVHTTKPNILLSRVPLRFPMNGASSGSSTVTPPAECSTSPLAISASMTASGTSVKCCSATSTHDTRARSTPTLVTTSAVTVTTGDDRYDRRYARHSASSFGFCLSVYIDVCGHVYSAKK